MGENPPTAVEAAQECVAQALSTNTPMHIFAGRTKSCLGRRLDDLHPVDVSGLDQLVSYEPGELILVARPGMRLEAVEDLLAEEKQHLPFEPPHWGERATLGGTVACNLSGPRRFKAGALRDYVLGIEMINGHGERIRAGGKVVKNVTGYDLSKVLSGSFGTLGVLTEICFKVWPQPETHQTLVVHGQDPGTALQLMLRLAVLPSEITGLAYLPASEPTAARTLARIEGPEPAVEIQVKNLSEDIRDETSVLQADESAIFWNSLRELELLQPAPGEQLWRFSIPPSSAGQLLEALKRHDLQRYGLDWGGGLVWALFPAGAQAGVLHQLALEHQGTVWRFASGEDDPNNAAFTPLSKGVARLNQALKNAFDPKGIFNPGRMYES